MKLLEELLNGDENPNFEVELTIEGKVFPVKTFASKGKSGGMTIKVKQRKDGLLTKTAEICCYADKEGNLSTTLSTYGQDRFKVRTKR